jgi:hypothetical protein
VDLFTLTKEFGLPLAMVILAVWALVSGKVIPRWYFDRESERANYWQQTAERLLELNSETQRVAREAGQVARDAVRKVTAPRQ